MLTSRKEVKQKMKPKLDTYSSEGKGKGIIHPVKSHEGPEVE
jgi:hypothetical protein